MFNPGAIVVTKNNRNLQHNVSMIKMLKEQVDFDKRTGIKRKRIGKNNNGFAMTKARKEWMWNRSKQWAIGFIIFLTGVAAVTAWGFS